MPAIDVENAWASMRPRMGTMSSTTGGALLGHQERADFPFLAVNIVERRPARTPDWVEGTRVFT